MDTKRSKHHHQEDLIVPEQACLNDAIDDDDIRRLWSYNSTAGGRYVYMTNNTARGDCSGYVVEATGEAQGKTMPLTDIRFDLPPSSNHFQPKFQLKFKKDNTWYSVNASEYSVTASEVTDTSFEVIKLYSPNKGLVVLRSNKKLDDDDLFLSSNGAGYMQLKVWNKPVRCPPRTTSEVDPALLFRVVRPLGQN
ncbi:Hypothetical predicted protein [Paramuricea clavata]|uniref:Uncharacterized protein n=1 Tax=Paramuricea clavata TaxID=317549 RepID=A0A7D9HWL8_PARCT|nr:Hypothetical predicted protein [Paramuricea clavata]